MKDKTTISRKDIPEDLPYICRRTAYDNTEKCCSCGYPVLTGETAMALHNGDLIHESCWGDYADENADYFGKKFTYTYGSEVEE